MIKLIDVSAVVVVTSLLSLLALLALDIETEQNDRDLESFRSQGFSLSLSLPQGEVEHESIDSLTNNTITK